MAPRSRTGVLIAGLILISIGLIFMLNNFYGVSAWRVIARYWPVILIIVGVKKLYGYFTWQEIPPVPGPSMKE